MSRLAHRAGRPMTAIGVDLPWPLSRPQRPPEPVPAERRVEIALGVWRLGGLDAQQYETGAVALADEARADGEIGLLRDRHGAPDAGADRDLLQVDAEAGMALLPAGLAVVAVIDAD